ncbi:AAA family ATPase [Hyphomicrobium sp. D-2]|uniref:AAA family ATPase n=1 Tax=Hyphomicrobium sp. D-2 TaxID=3041621 RepID=UPI002457B243|nr:AAA family ATPase [Hyphomicrobium sp. D-2]MDH4981351.1 AAA family ATPase [Hyphomicrobium sp. D-2]
MANSERQIVITGGPGAGKSTLVAALARHGAAVMPEAGRAIIQAQDAIGGGALPNVDRRLFAELMLSWDLRSYREGAERNRLTFYDRGIPDCIGYLELNGMPVPNHFEIAARMHRYGRHVFVAPPWAQIFTQDAERTQSFDEAVATHDAICAVYRRLGYELIPLPCGTVDSRVGMVLAEIATSLRCGEGP